ncbi:otefin [Contarinia nasturtii]|uniref:otefin n=1 Tax=Contarinia nasturtii TaxID=265458 RepID=UPI0012D3A830|nr:otefin [Contarinia nasturtii]XP_031626769.1 otefin [Contarinia nasturtii]
MDNFEQLSNTELRDQLKAHNLGNFPVTDTTRNALIKKLRNALNGPAPKSVKARRETLAVVKNVSAEESESDAELKKINKPKTVSNRRATIAAGTTALKSSVKQTAEVVADTAPVSKSKANGVVNDKTPVKAAAPLPSKSPSRKAELYFDDASDDDLIAAAAEFEKQARRKTSRTSRSPSLTKSSVVTTSYKHTIEPLVELNDDVILINDNSDAEYSSEMLEKIRKPSTPTTKINPPADSRRKTMQLGPSISTNYSSIKATEKPIEDTGSTYRRRFTTYATPMVTAEANTKGLNESHDDFMNKIEAPFLSDFTRRLAQLKAEQLPGTENTYDYRSPKSTTSAYLNEYRSSIYGSGGRVGDRYRADKPITSTLKQQEKPSKLSALENRFRLPLLIVLSIFVVVVVYVFLFSYY